MIVFSATIPSWLKKSVSRYMSKENFAFINLIDQSQKKTAINIEHFSVKINEKVQLDRLILSLFEEHATTLEQSQMIIFCQTKAECDRLIQSNQINSYPSAVLHGDLSQNRREQVLKVEDSSRRFSAELFFSFSQNFRQGSIRFLITTDISARGLDIPQVDLIVLTSPPQVSLSSCWPREKKNFERLSFSFRRTGNLTFIDLDELGELDEKESRFVFTIINNSNNWSLFKQKLFVRSLNWNLFSIENLLKSFLEHRIQTDRFEVASWIFQNQLTVFFPVFIDIKQE